MHQHTSKREQRGRTRTSTLGDTINDGTTIRTTNLRTNPRSLRYSMHKPFTVGNRLATSPHGPVRPASKHGVASVPPITTDISGGYTTSLSSRECTNTRRQAFDCRVLYWDKIVPKSNYYRTLQSTLTPKDRKSTHPLEDRDVSVAERLAYIQDAPGVVRVPVREQDGADFFASNLSHHFLHEYAQSCAMR